jgi:predicted ArsR family transcriptional regulator
MIVNGKEFLTVKEMAERLEISPNTAKHRLFQAGIAPTTKDALYDEAALEAIRNVPGKGRPAKDKPEVPAKPKKGRPKK